VRDSGPPGVVWRLAHLPISGFALKVSLRECRLFVIPLHECISNQPMPAIASVAFVVFVPRRSFLVATILYCHELGAPPDWFLLPGVTRSRCCLHSLLRGPLLPMLSPCHCRLGFLERCAHIPDRMVSTRACFRRLFPSKLSSFQCWSDSYALSFPPPSGPRTATASSHASPTLCCELSFFNSRRKCSMLSQLYQQMTLQLVLHDDSASFSAMPR